MSYYNVLGISKTATNRDIKKAFKKVISMKHPDRGGNAEIARKLIEMRDILLDPEKRKKYDETLTDKGHESRLNTDLSRSDIADIEKYYSIVQREERDYRDEVERLKAESKEYDIYDNSKEEAIAAQRELQGKLDKLKSFHEFYLRYYRERYGITQDLERRYREKTTQEAREREQPLFPKR